MNIKILVVDDTPVEREFCKDILEMEEFEVDVAENGYEAIKKLQKKQYDIVLTDLAMPEITGIDVLKYTKEHFSDIEVVIMTFYGTVTTVIEAFKLGCYTYILKPLKRDELVTTIKKCYEVKQKSKQIKELNMQIAQAEKLSALGRFAASVAHQVRNPLSAIRTTTEYILEKYSLQGEIKEDVSSILKYLVSIEKIITEILNVSRIPKLNLEKVDIEKIIDSSIKEVLDRINKLKVKIVKELQENYIITADNFYLKEVFLNILNNSLDAMENIDREKTIKIKCYKEKIKLEQRRSTDIFKSTPEVVVVEIEDNGEGISEESQKRLFEPFFTTKQNGVGLGLFFIYEIIKHLNGMIKIESKENIGTKVTITLPLI